MDSYSNSHSTSRVNDALVSFFYVALQSTDKSNKAHIPKKKSFLNTHVLYQDCHRGPPIMLFICITHCGSMNICLMLPFPAAFALPGQLCDLPVSPDSIISLPVTCSLNISRYLYIKIPHSSSRSKAQRQPHPHTPHADVPFHTGASRIPLCLRWLGISRNCSHHPEPSVAENRHISHCVRGQSLNETEPFGTQTATYPPSTSVHWQELKEPGISS